MNRWKVAFFSLAALICFVIIVVIILLSKGQEHHFTIEPPEFDGEPIFFIETSKKRFNQFIQSQLETIKHDRDKLDFTVELTDFVNVHGYMTIFSKKVRFQMQLTPYVQENGNLLLSQHAFYIGDLPIPSKYVLTFIRSNLNLPSWIVVKPENGTILIRLNELEISENLHMKISSFDLKNDELLFEIMATYE